jgi:hypothetical protein
MARWTNKKATVTFLDNVGTSLTVGPGEGDLSLDNLMFGNFEMIEARNRGVHDGLVEGPDAVQSFSLTIQLRRETFTHASQSRLTDWLLRANSYSALQSVDSNNDLWAYKLQYSLADGATTGSILLPKITSVFSFAESAENCTFSISGTSYLAPVFT